MGGVRPEERIGFDRVRVGDFGLSALADTRHGGKLINFETQYTTNSGRSIFTNDASTCRYSSASGLQEIAPMATMASRLRSGVPVETSQSCTVRSSPPKARSRPSGLKATARIGRLLSHLDIVQGDVEEARAFLKLLGWELPPGLDDATQKRYLTPWNAETAEKRFLARFKELSDLK